MEPLQLNTTGLQAQPQFTCTMRVSTPWACVLHSECKTGSRSGVTGIEARCAVGI